MTDGKNDIGLSANGYCVVTDRDGDKLFLTWEGGNDTKAGEGKGTAQYTGGTGKYAGIKGKYTYNYVAILPGAEGYARINGEWQLP